MTGDDVLFFLEDIWFDLMHLGQADVVSMLFRIMLVVFGTMMLIGLMQFIFGSFFRLLGEILESVRRAVSRLFFWRRWLRRMRALRAQRKWDKEHRAWAETAGTAAGLEAATGGAGGHREVEGAGKDIEELEGLVSLKDVYFRFKAFYAPWGA